MRARDVMTRTVVGVRPGTPIDRVHAVMIRRGIRHLPVVEGRKIVGILSDRDLLLRVDLQPDGVFQYPDATAADIMTRSPRTCRLGDPISKVARLIVKGRIDCVPVVDAGKRLLGIISSVDLVNLLADDNDDAT